MFVYTLMRMNRTKETFIDGYEKYLHLRAFCKFCSSSWLRTGDQVIINENAEIFIVDRLKVKYVHPLLVD
jgi:hypothetical protein